MKVLSVVLYFFFLCKIGLSQSTNLIENPDTIRKFFPGTHGTKKWKPHVSLDANRSFYEGKLVKLNGVRLGVEYLGTHRFGLGYYWLNKKGLLIDVPIDLPNSGIDTSIVKLNLSYGTLFYERLVFKSKRWDIAIPSHFGAGVIRENDEIEGSEILTNPSFWSLGSGVVTKFYIFPWLAPHVGFHYRQLFNSQKSIRDAFNGPYFSFGAKLMVGELYKVIFKPKSD